MPNAKPKKKTPQALGGEVDRTLIYSLQGAAKALGMSARWISDNLIDTDAIPYRKQGDCKLIPGWVLAQWVEADLRTKSEWEQARGNTAWVANAGRRAA